MAKIYNEIVIDMNPESSTFEETLYEDSFEYNGELDLLQWDEESPDYGGGIKDLSIAATIAYIGSQVASSSGSGFSYSGAVYYDSQGNKYTMRWHKTKSGKVKHIEVYKNGKLIVDDAFAGKETLDYARDRFSDYVVQEDIKLGGEGQFWTEEEWSELDEARELTSDVPVGEREDIGDEPMTSERWFGMTQEEQAKYIFEYEYGVSDADWTTEVDKDDGTVITFKDIMDQLEIQPLLGEIDPEEKERLKTTYGGEDVSFGESITGKGAGTTLAGSLADIRSKAPQFSPSTSISTGYGVGRRKNIAGQKLLRESLEAGYDAYGLSEHIAGLDYESGIYDLEEGLETDWQRDWMNTYFGEGSILPEATG